MSNTNNDKKTSKTNHPGLFTKGGRNGKTYEKWTEDEVHKVLDELEEWLMDEESNNIFFKDFLFKKRLYVDWIKYVSDSFESVSERLSNIKAVQEHKLVSGGVFGKTNAPMTKFILQANYGYAEKLETTNTNTNNNTITWNEEKSYDKGE